MGDVDNGKVGGVQTKRHKRLGLVDQPSHYPVFVNLLSKVVVRAHARVRGKCEEIKGGEGQENAQPSGFG